MCLITVTALPFQGAFIAVVVVVVVGVVLLMCFAALVLLQIRGKGADSGLVIKPDELQVINPPLVRQ